VTTPHDSPVRAEAQSLLARVRVYALEPRKMIEPVTLQQNMELAPDGQNLAGALTSLRDKDDESYALLKLELQKWLPEFSAIRLDTDNSGRRTFGLLRADSKDLVPSKDLSDGTLIALALLTIAYSPNPPSLVCLEEPDRGLHPRLLRSVRDALYRLSYPEQFGLTRDPVQVIATTHSPHFLDLFKDHPEDIIIAEKLSDGTASFRSLTEDTDLIEAIGDAPLGEAWYSGVLGGVPALK
jgi:predicted ATPase